MKSQENNRQSMRPWQRNIVIFLALILFAVLFLMSPPTWDSAEELPTVPKGLERRCTLTVDRQGVPHLQASSQEALFYCWGKLQALDRGWQMDYFRRLVYGRLSELYGSKFLKRDFFFRLFNFKKIAQRWIEHEKKHPTKISKLLKFYVWGINEAFRQLRKRKNWPYQFKKYGVNLAPWRLIDTYSIVLMQSFYQTNKTAFDDLMHARWRAALGKKRYEEIFGLVNGAKLFDQTIIKRGEHPLVKPKKAALLKKRSSHHLNGLEEKRWLPTLTKLTELFKIPGKEFSEMGSNNWVIAPKLTKNGHALLANDPHLKITTPAFWHEIHIKAPNIDVLGVSLPGAPAILSGNNRHVAWGLTNGYSNSADLVIIRENADHTFNIGKKKYKIEKFTPVVWVKVEAFYLPIFWKSFERSEIGPILPFKGPKGEKLLLRWTGYHIATAPLKTSLQMLSVSSAKELDEVLKGWTLPNWNYVFADDKGNIGYRQVGLIAKRLAGRRGFLDPKNPKERWQGFLSPDEMPHLFNPKRGFIATANNRAFPSNYPFFLGYAYTVAHRAHRIEELIAQLKPHTLQTMQKIQLDTLSPDAVILLPHLLAILDKIDLSKESPAFKEALSILKRWKKTSHRHEVAPTIFRVWYNFLDKELFLKDKITPGTIGIFRVLTGKIRSGSSKKLPEIIRETLQKTIAKLTEDLGKDLKKWRWGRYHKMHFQFLLQPYPHWQPKPQPKDGDDASVNPAACWGKGPFEVKVGASYRLVVELSQPIRSFGVLAGKITDKNPTQLSRDQKLWLDGRYRPRPFYSKEYRSKKKTVWTF